MARKAEQQTPAVARSDVGMVVSFHASNDSDDLMDYIMLTDILGVLILVDKSSIAFWWFSSLLWNMAIEIVDLPIKHFDFP